jgi:protein gp37
MGCGLSVHDVPFRYVDIECEHGSKVYGPIAPYPDGFAPTFHKYRLNDPDSIKKPQTIFVCSMADLFGEWVPDEWIQAVFSACDTAPQHRYLFLTKNPKRYEKVLDRYFPPNMWFGWSQDGPMGDALKHSTHHSIQSFVSIEPLHRPFKCFNVRGLDWAIVGAETGNRKGKIIPEKAWVDDIAEACAENNVPLFMKESLREIMGPDFKQELPF